MDQIALILCGIITLIGGILTWYWSNHYEKIIGVGIMAGGVMPPLIGAEYLDAAIIVALVSPFATIILLLMIREDEGNKKTIGNNEDISTSQEEI
jgi:energy-converting hydrogenase Eha subunit C